MSPTARPHPRSQPSCPIRLRGGLTALMIFSLSACSSDFTGPVDGPLEPSAGIIDIIDLAPPIADFPNPRPDQAVVEPGKAVVIDVLANDADTVSITYPVPDSSVAPITVRRPVRPQLVGFTQPKRGRVTLNASGTLTYTSTSPRWGADQFTYTVVNAKGLAASTTVTVHVWPRLKVTPRWPLPDSTEGGH